VRYLLVVLAALFLNAFPAHADPISASVDHATMLMGPNIAGDNISFTFTGIGVDIEGTGGMACFDWCTGEPIPVGTPINLTQVFVSSFTRTVVGGVSYDPNSDFGVFGGSSFFDDAGGLNASVHGFVGEGPTFNEFFITMPSGGGWTLNFTPATDEQGNATQAFVNGTFFAGTTTPAPIPEPGTLGLMLLASTVIWITVRQGQLTRAAR
jgi:hypothetical protein